MPRPIATNTTADIDELLAFVRPRHRYVLTTRRTDGTPQAPPVTGGVDESRHLVVSTYPERAKARKARRNPQISVPELSDEWSGARTQIYGTAEVLDVPDALDAFVEHYRNISGEHWDWDEYRQAKLAQGKSLIRITPTDWGPIATGEFPAGLASLKSQCVVAAVAGGN